MGSSARKKREKKKDFQKPKLKVGKARPKPSNQTDTSFRAKAIVLNQQSLHITAPTSSAQFAHHLSLLSSRSDSQRRDSLAYLTSSLPSISISISTSTSTTSTSNTPLPQPLSTLLPRVSPLLLDISPSVRSQALRFLRALPPADVADHAPDILPFVRAGLTHLAADVRVFSVEVLSWLLEVGGDEVVSCRGGWTKTLNCLMAMVGWVVAGGNGSGSGAGAGSWSSSGARVGFGRGVVDGKVQARNLVVLGEFLRVGLCAPTLDDGRDEEELHSAQASFPLWHVESHAPPARSNAYGYLNLFGAPRDDDTDMLEDREDRIRVFKIRFGAAVEGGLASARRDGGEVGRAAGLVAKALKGVELGGVD